MAVSTKVYQSFQNSLLVIQEDFPILSCNMPVRNSVCNPDKPIIKYVRKSLLKSFCTTILGKIFGTKQRDTIKLGETSKI